MKISFCVIKTPFSVDENDFTIFLTKVGSINMDYSIKKDTKYNSIVLYLKKNKYFAIDDFSFGYLGNITKKISKKEIIENIRKNGASYGVGFEKNMIQEFETMKDFINPQTATSILHDFIFNLKGELKNELKIDEKIKKIIHTPYCKKIPKVGDKINLSFYLVLDFLYDKNKSGLQIDLNGSFLFEKQNLKRYKNIVKVITECFEIFEHENSGNDGFIYFRSIKTKGEILNEISFLYEVVVDIVNNKKNSKNKSAGFEKVEYYFDLFDIRDKINLNEKIIISVDSNDYDGMIELSENIKNNSKQNPVKKIDFLEIEDTCNELKQQLNVKMLEHADCEEFQSASQLQKDIKTINDKIKDFKKNNPNSKKISLDMFHTHFNLK